MGLEPPGRAHTRYMHSIVHTSELSATVHSAVDTLDRSYARALDVHSVDRAYARALRRAVHMPDTWTRLCIHPISRPPCTRPWIRSTVHMPERSTCIRSTVPTPEHSAVHSSKYTHNLAQVTFNLLCSTLSNMNNTFCFCLIPLGSQLA